MTVEYKTEAAVFEALRAMYPEQAYAVLPSVPDTTGTGRTRTADAIVIGLWPSRGLEIEGFEIKVSRADCLKELKQVNKSAPVQKYCDRWWIVAGVRGIVDAAELPKTWGLIQPYGESLRREVPAPQLEPAEVNRGFVAALMRQYCRHELPEAALNLACEAARKEGLSKGIEIGKNSVGGDHKRLQSAYDQLRERVDAFEAASGITLLSGWSRQLEDGRSTIADHDPFALGRAVATVLKGDKELEHARSRLGHFKSDLQRILTQLDNMGCK